MNREKNIFSCYKIFLAVILIVFSSPIVVHATAPSETLVYVMPSGERYHKKNCYHLSDGYTVMSLETAYRRGYSPCRDCDPPILDYESRQRIKDEAVKAEEPESTTPVESSTAKVNTEEIVKVEKYKQSDQAIKLWESYDESIFYPSIWESLAVALGISFLLWLIILWYKETKTAPVSPSPSGGIAISEKYEPAKIRYCSKCGKPIDPESRKCTGCGKQYMKKSLIITSALMLAVLFLAASTFYFYIQYNRAIRAHFAYKDAINQEFKDRFGELTDPLTDKNISTVEDYLNAIDVQMVIEGKEY